MIPCGAKSRRGTPCRRPAGWGTDHQGAGRCKLHGGRSTGPRSGHGLYSTKTARLGDLLVKHRKNPEPRKLEEELAVLRASVDRFMERFDPEEDRHYDLLASLVDRVSRVVKRLEDTDAQNAVSQRDLFRTMELMGLAVRQHAPEESWERISAAWGSLRL